MLNFLRKYRGVFSLILAAIILAAAYFLAWMPVWGEDFQIRVEKSWGDPAAMENFVLIGTLTDSWEKTDFSLDKSGLSQKSQAVPLDIEKENHTVFAQNPCFLPGETIEEIFTVTPEEQPGCYEFTQQLQNRHTQLVWGFYRLHFYDPADCYVQIHTGLTYPESVCLTKSGSGGIYESEPSGEMIRELLSDQDFSASEELLDTIFGKPHMESAIEVDGTIYFVPTVSELWEGTRYIYRIDQGEPWASVAFATAAESFGQVTPITEVQNGSNLDILGIYATLDGTLVLAVERHDDFLFQMYDPETGKMTGEVSAPGLWPVENASFQFFPDENGFCAGFVDWEAETSTLVAITNQDTSWHRVQEVRQVPFSLEHARSDGETLVAIGSKEQSSVCGAVWEKDELAYEVQLYTPAEQDKQNSGDTRRFLQDFFVERRDSRD